MLKDPMAVIMLLILLSGIGLVVVTVGSTYWIRHLRRVAFSKFAVASGFSYSQKLNSYTEIGIPEMALFSAGFNQSYWNVVRGEIEGAEVAAFDFSFVMVWGLGTTRVTQTVVAVSVGDTPLPNFTLTRKRLRDKLGEALDNGDITVDTSHKISKTYRLRGAKEDLIRALFNERAIEIFMTDLACRVEVSDGWLFIIEDGKTLMASEVQGKIEAAFTFLYELTGATRCQGLL